MISAITESRHAEILLVEDNDNDVELTRLGFKKCKMLLNLHHAKDGVECMAFLRKQGQYSDAPTPDLILLDLNMPRMGGREVLAEMATDDALNSIPVVVLTTSENEAEVQQSYALRCNSYIVKPVDFQKFQGVIASIADYWFSVVVLPTRCG